MSQKGHFSAYVFPVAPRLKRYTALNLPESGYPAPFTVICSGPRASFSWPTSSWSAILATMVILGGGGCVVVFVFVCFVLVRHIAHGGEPDGGKVHGARWMLPTGLLVGGSINWSGRTTWAGQSSIGSSAYVKVGNMTGSVVPSNGNNPTYIVPTGDGLGQGRSAQIVQPSSSVNQSGLINFASAFSTFANRSADMATCTTRSGLTNANGIAAGHGAPMPAAAELTQLAENFPVPDSQ